MSDSLAHSSGHGSPPPALRRTPLAERHIAMGAKMVPFAGYLMPVQYPGGITAEHTAILNTRGTIEDDCLVYRFADRIMLVVNAGNREKDWGVLRAALDTSAPRFDCTLADASDAIALLALQGPEAQRILQPLAETDLAAIRYYWFVEAIVAGVPVILSRTGYTG